MWPTQTTTAFRFTLQEKYIGVLFDLAFGYEGNIVGRVPVSPHCRGLLSALGW